MTLASLRRTNSYEFAGSFGAGSEALDELVIEHLETQRAMRGFSAVEEMVVRLSAEGFAVEEIALELGVSTRTVVRVRRQLTWTLFGDGVVRLVASGSPAKAERRAA